MSDITSCHGERGGAVAPAGAPVIALAGAPNVGKSTLFNALTGARRTVGNWPGTTVEVGRGMWAGMDLIDLPGAYSLDPASPDEELTRALILDVPADEVPDVVVVATDAAHLARSLYMVAQLREHPLRVVVALTMNDIARRRGTDIDVQQLSAALGVPVVEIDPRKRAGIDQLEPVVRAALAAPVPEPRPFETLTPFAPQGPGGDSASLTPLGAGGDSASLTPQGPGLVAEEGAEHPSRSRDVYPVAKERPEGASRSPELDEFALADDRFAWIDAVVQQAVSEREAERINKTSRFDKLALNPILGPILFLAVMWVVFQITTTVAAPLQDFLDGLFAGTVSDWARAGLESIGAGAIITGLLVDGIIAGVGMVLTFLPLMALMFILLSLLEDSGYMARAAVVSDKVMRWMGLPGKAFLPLIVGFGCNVPAISATRVLSTPRQRLLTALLVPFTSCTARLTVFVFMGTIFFPGNAGNVVFIMYLVSILLIVATGVLLKNTLWRAMGSEPLIMDLPPYQRPTLGVVGASMWARLKGFLQTATSVILVTVIAVWALQAIPVRGDGGFAQVDPGDSAYGAVAETIAPAFSPAGFGIWESTGALITGFVAKEAVISSWAQTFAVDDPGEKVEGSALSTKVLESFTESSGGHPLPAAWAFMVFMLAYTPCVATLAAQRREIGLKWTLIGMVIQLAVAWSLAVAVFQIGRLFW